MLSKFYCEQTQQIKIELATNYNIKIKSLERAASVDGGVNIAEEIEKEKFATAKKIQLYHGERFAAWKGAAAGLGKSRGSKCI